MVYFDVSGVDGEAMKVLEHYHPAQIKMREQTDLISVVIAAYNIADYIERGVNLTRSQTYQNLRLLSWMTVRRTVRENSVTILQGKMHVYM